jgi:hypothetical protein
MPQVVITLSTFSTYCVRSARSPVTGFTPPFVVQPTPTTDELVVGQVIVYFLLKFLKQRILRDVCGFHIEK